MTGQVVEVLGVVRDVNQEYETELALRDREARHRGRLVENDGGTGLGLAGVRYLAGLQRGRARVTGKLDAGTMVTVELAGTATGDASSLAPGSSQWWSTRSQT